MTVAVITGGAGALGGAIAELLLAKGTKVALFDRKLATTQNASAFAYAGDFSREDVWTAALAEAKTKLGEAPSSAALVAGGWAGGKPLHEETADATYESMMRANVDTVHRALRSLLPGLVAQKSGSIVIVGSRAAAQPWTSGGAAAYAASKAAVVALAQATAQEVLHYGVRVNAILPSTLDTPANRAAMPKAPHGDWVSLASAAKLVAFLFSDDAKDVTGAAIPIYGRA